MNSGNMNSGDRQQRAETAALDETIAAPDGETNQHDSDQTTAATSGTGNNNGDRPVEHGGRPGPEPTRYGDWEKNGRCIDF